MSKCSIWFKNSSVSPVGYTPHPFNGRPILQNRTSIVCTRVHHSFTMPISKIAKLKAKWHIENAKLWTSALFNWILTINNNQKCVSSTTSIWNLLHFTHDLFYLIYHWFSFPFLFKTYFQLVIGWVHSVGENGCETSKWKIFNLYFGWAKKKVECVCGWEFRLVVRASSLPFFISSNLNFVECEKWLMTQLHGYHKATTFYTMPKFSKLNVHCRAARSFTPSIDTYVCIIVYVVKVIMYSHNTLCLRSYGWTHTSTNACTWALHNIQLRIAWHVLFSNGIDCFLVLVNRVWCIGMRGRRHMIWLGS